MCPQKKIVSLFRCPFQAIDIINLPAELDKDTTHRFGINSFKLHRLPTPRPGTVLGLIGCNGIGKSTALKILANKLKPNLGRVDDPPDWSAIIKHFRGSELQNFLQRMVENKLKSIVKVQYVDQIASLVKGTVRDTLARKNERNLQENLIQELQLTHLLDRDIAMLSGGELQRFAICVVCMQESDIYLFDEPSSFLDIKQRLAAARVIRATCDANRYCVVVEHDLSVLDYLSDHICCMYGKPGVYGVVTMPYAVRDGINVFLSGFLPSENLRFRDTELTFRGHDNTETKKDTKEKHDATMTPWPQTSISLGEFHLDIEPGAFSQSEVVVMVGENGTGKTTFMRMLAGLHPCNTLPTLHVSYKPQMIMAKFRGTVRQLLHTKIRGIYTTPQFDSDVLRPLQIASIMDQDVTKLSGGELQRVAITLCLGKPAKVYILDEPSAYLDSEQRIACAQVIKRFVLQTKTTAFVVDHDFIMVTYLADKIIVFSGEPGVNCVAHSPQSLLVGMNRFLKLMDITFRRDPSNHRPRINKWQSTKDQEQKKSGSYFYLDTDSI